MTKPESYGITARQVHANKSVSDASHVLIKSFGILIREGKFEAIKTALNEKGKILKDLWHSQKMLLDRCKKLSAENEALKMMWQSVEQERNDYEQNRKFLKRLIDENERLKNKS